MSEFNDVVGMIYEHYHSLGYTMDSLAAALNVSKCCLQKWKSKDVRPNNGSMQYLYDFLDRNDGEQFILMLKRLPMNVVEAEPDTIVFPPGFDDVDKDYLKNSFLDP